MKTLIPMASRRCGRLEGTHCLVSKLALDVVGRGLLATCVGTTPLSMDDAYAEKMPTEVQSLDTKSIHGASPSMSSRAADI
jgi:hypothetical protein